MCWVVHRTGGSQSNREERQVGKCYWHNAQIITSTISHPFKSPLSCFIPGSSHHLFKEQTIFQARIKGSSTTGSVAKKTFSSLHLLRMWANWCWWEINFSAGTNTIHRRLQRVSAVAFMLRCAHPSALHSSSPTVCSSVWAHLDKRIHVFFLRRAGASDLTMPGTNCSYFEGSTRSRL